MKVQEAGNEMEETLVKTKAVHFGFGGLQRVRGHLGENKRQTSGKIIWL